MQKERVLFFTRTMGVGGTEKVILQIVENLQNEFDEIIICSAGGIHEEKLKKMGIKHYKIGDIEKKNIVNILRVLVSVFSIIKKERISMVHTHHRMAAFYSNLLKIFFDFKFIHTAHNTFFDKKILTKFSLYKANIIAVGERVKENLCEFYNISNEKVKVIYNGIEKDCNSIKEVEEIQKYKRMGWFIVGNIGRLSKQKGMEYYIEAIPDVIKKNKKVIFFIIGDGEDRKKLNDLSIKLNIQENLKFLGYRNDVANIIKQLDLVILSSLWEGLPLTPIEAFSQNKTIIATNVDGTPEIVTDNYNGILIEAKNSCDISYNVDKLCNDIELRRRLENNALLTFEKKFTLDLFISNYKEYYNYID